MANQTSSTPVKVPSSAGNYTPATLDSDLRSQVNTLLIKDGHNVKIHEYMLHQLHAHQSNWPTLVQSHALQLLRSGEVTTFPALMRRVLDDVRHDVAAAPVPNGSNGTNGADVNGGPTNKSGGGPANGSDKSNNTGAARGGLALPPAVVEDALKITRECLEEVCEMDDDEEEAI